MSSKKILIADDEPTIIAMLKTRLTTAGYEIITARDGVEALEKVKSEKPDLVVMDVLMPRLTGFEALKKIRDNPDSHRTPVIVISAKSNMRGYFDDIPWVEFICKPYEAAELIARIGILLGAGVSAARPKRVILAGVEDFLIGKIRTFLSSKNYQVLTALNEEDAFLMAKNLGPAFLLCQYWEEESILDAKKLASKLAGDVSLAHIPFFVYCRKTLALDAMKIFKGDRLITYDDSVDLLRELGILVEKMA